MIIKKMFIVVMNITEKIRGAIYQQTKMQIHFAIVGCAVVPHKKVFTA